MTGQIAGPSVFSLELVGLVIGVSMIVGAVDSSANRDGRGSGPRRTRRPISSWSSSFPWSAWASTSSGPGPRWPSIASAGRAASLPFERFGEDNGQEAPRTTESAGTDHAPPVGFGQLRQRSAATRRTRSAGRDRAPDAPGPVEVVQHLLQQRGDVGPLDLRGPPLTLARPYRPQQRTSLDESDRRPAHRPRRVEGRPDRPPPVPLLGRLPVDGERGRRRRAVAGHGQLAEPAAPRPV